MILNFSIIVSWSNIPEGEFCESNEKVPAKVLAVARVLTRLVVLKLLYEACVFIPYGKAG